MKSSFSLQVRSAWTPAFWWSMLLAILLAQAPMAIGATSEPKLTLNQHIAAVNNWGNRKELEKDFTESVAKNSGNTVTTLAALRKKTVMPYGDIIATHAVASAAGLKFDQVRTEHARMNWSTLAKRHNVPEQEIIAKLQAVQDDMKKAEERLLEQMRTSEESLRRQAEMQTQPPVRRYGGYGGQGGQGGGASGGGNQGTKKQKSH